MKKIIMFASLALALVSCGNMKGKKDVEAAVPAQMGAPKVTVSKVSVGEVEQTEQFTSTIEPNVINNIAPQTTLRIKDIKVEIGDFVKAGQVVAEMDVFNLEQIRLQMLNDSTELARVKSLYEVGGVSKSELDNIQLSFNVRKTSYLNLLENTVLRSPISGVITARNYDKGDMYTMSQPIYTVQEITPVKLIVAISEKDYTKIKKGNHVTLSVDAFPGESFTGTIRRIYPTMDAATHTFQCEVEVSNVSKRLRPGMYAKVTVNFGVNKSVIVPDRAIVKQQGSGEKFVYVLNEDGTVTYQKVVLGVRMGSQVEVLEGLYDGAKVVVEGTLRVKDGIQVEAVEE